MKQGYRVAMAAALLFGGAATAALAQEGTTPGAERDFSKIGAGTGTFLNLPVGARATAIGASFSGIADDASALFWNPAGITQIEGTSVLYSYAAMFSGIRHQFAGVTFPIGEDYNIGVSALSYGTDEIERTTMFDQEGNGATYTVQDLAVGLSLAGQLTEQFAFGVTGKFVSLKMAEVTASTVAFDFGTLYVPGILGLRIAFGVQHLSAPLEFKGTDLVRSGGVSNETGNQNPDNELVAGGASLPLTFRAGLATDLFEGDEEGNSLLVSTEFSTASDRPEYVGLGVEYTWNDIVSARVGYQVGSDEAWGLSGGLGLSYDTGSFAGRIDYGIRPHETMGLVNMISASLRLQ